jgi:hypothetical protein
MATTFYNYVGKERKTCEAVMADVAEPGACEACGRPLQPQQGRGRRRLYCNARCRDAARRERARPRGPRRRDVKEFLTDGSRHEYLDVMEEGAPGAAHPVAVQVADAARRLAAELSRAGSPRDAVAAARDLSAAADAALQAVVDRARTAGVSWREIGDVLSTSRQAAFQRFGHPVDPRTGEPMSREVPPDAADRAVAIFVWHGEGRWEEILAQLDERMGARLDADLLVRGWAHMAGLFGQFEGTGEPFARRADDDVMVDVPLRFEAGEARGVVRFDSDGRVAGLAIRPASSSPG